jgi:hypothetical protein
LLCLLACCCCWAPPSRGVRPPALVSWPAALAVCCALANDDKLTSKSLRQSGAWRPHVDLPASSLKKEGVACHWHERTTPDLLTPSQHMAAMRAVTPACPHPFRAVQQLPRACRAIGHDDPRRYGAQTSNLWSTRVLGVRLLLRGGPACCALLCCPLLPHTHPFAAARPPQTSRFQCPRPHITSAPLRKGVRSPPRHRESNRHGTVTPRAPRPALRPTAKAACRSAMGRSSGPAYCLFSTLDPGGAAGHSVPQPASLSAALLPSLHAHRAAL